MTLKEETLLHDPSISYWLKDAIKSLDQRDIVDVLKDVTLLKEIQEQKFKDIKERRINV